MLSLASIFAYILEAVAIGVGVFFITKKNIGLAELGTLVITIALSFMILDLWSPGVASGARQGSGFGLGWSMVGGSPNPEQYYEGYEGQSCTGEGCKATEPSLEGFMDDPTAIKYYRNYNPPYESNVLPPAIPINLNDPRQEAPPIPSLTSVPKVGTPIPQGSAKPVENMETEAMEAEGFDGHHTEPKIRPPEGPRTMSIIARRLRENPFETTVRAVTQIDNDGGSFYSPTDPHPDIIAPNPPLLYNMLTPPYGYRYQLPRGWDQLEQPGLPIAFNKFRNTAKAEASCQVGPFGPEGQYNPDYHYPMEKKKLQ